MEHRWTDLHPRWERAKDGSVDDAAQQQKRWFPFYADGHSFLGDHSLKRALFGTAIGGFVYPYIVLAIVVVPTLLEDKFTSADVEYLFASVVGVSLVSFFVNCLITPPLATIAIAITSVVAHTLSRRPSWPVIAGTGAGLLGFLVTSLYHAFMIWSYRGPTAYSLFIGPALATIVLQLGATWTTVPNEYSEYGERLPMSHEPPWLRFDIRQILIATAWIAGILSLLKVTHILGPWSASIVATWFVYQAATLWGVLRVVKRVRG